MSDNLAPECVSLNQPDPAFDWKPWHRLERHARKRDTAKKRRYWQKHRMAPPPPPLPRSIGHNIFPLKATDCRGSPQYQRTVRALSDDFLALVFRPKFMWPKLHHQWRDPEQRKAFSKIDW